MKRMIAIVLMLLCLCACAKDTAPAGQNPVDSKPASDQPKYEIGINSEMILEGSTDKLLFKNELCSLTLVKAEIDSLSDYCWDVLLENYTDGALTFSFGRTYLNDFDFDPLWAQRVEAGETAETSIIWSSLEMQDRGISQVTRVDTNLRVSDAVTSKLLVNCDLTVYPSIKSAHIAQSRAPVTTDIVVADEDDYKLIFVGYDDQTRWGKELKLYVHNRANTPIVVTLENVTVNDQPCEPNWRYVLDGGKQGYSKIVWFQSALDQAGVEGTPEFEYEIVLSTENGSVLTRIPHTFVP